MVKISSTYEPGSWIGIVRSGTAVLLQPHSDPALVNTVWELLGKTPEAHEVLHAVTNASGLSLAKIPSFGIVDFKNSLRVFLRGGIELTARLAAGTVELSGRDVTTWTERRLADVQGFRVALPGGGDGAWDGTRGGELPLGEGVVLLTRLRMENSEPDRIPAPDAVTVTGDRTEDRVFAYKEASHETVMAIPDEDFSYTSHEVFHAPEEEAVVAERKGDAPEKVAVVAERKGDAPEEEAVVAEQEADAPEEEGHVHGQEVDAPEEEEHVDEQAADAPEEEEDVAEQAPEMTSSYDHLWEKTVVRNIEDAAVREDPKAGPGPEDSGPQHSELEDSGLEQPEPLEPAAGHSVEQSFEPAQQPPQAPAAAASAGLGTMPQDGLIDSVPWRTAGLSQNLPWTPPSFAAPAAAQPQQEPAPQGPPPVTPPVDEGDHDGETIMKTDLGDVTDRLAVPGDAVSDISGPTVLARVCQLGHANPPTNSQCSSCGALLPDDAIQVQRPPLGRMRLSTGELIDLDQSLIVGRQPSVSRVQGSVMPRLVQVASPSGDISRSHVEVRLEGWHVMLCDLKATNGTVLVREGQPPRRLAQGEMAILLDGDIAELGDDVSLRFEEIL